MIAYRYSDEGVLVECPDHGDGFCEPLPPAEPRWWLWPARERRIDHGVYAADLAREARLPGGPPVWFRPNLARRRRWAGWAATPALKRAGQPPPEIGPRIEFRTLVGHRYRFATGPGPFPGVPGTPQPSAEALLYLPAGEQPTEQHGSDVRKMALFGARPVCMADVRAHVPPELLRLAGDDRVAAEIQFANRQCRYPREGGRLAQCRVIEERLATALLPTMPHSYGFLLFRTAC